MKIITIVGARPQFIKAAPVSRAIARYNDHGEGRPLTEILVHTGQHYDYNMSQVFFDQLKIPKPHYHLGVGSGKHGQMTGAMLSGIEEVLIKETPDWVLVYGDTNSTLAGALAASKLHIPVTHVEAGLRSYNRRMPEEINRVLTDHISTILFCPTRKAVLNLAQEGIQEGVCEVGDVMYDSFLYCKDLALQESSILEELELIPGKYFLATVHRQENTDDLNQLRRIFSVLEEIAGAHCPVILPLHPRTLKNLNGTGMRWEKSPLRIIPPVSYLDMVALESQALLILTDSGGVQKEAYFCRIPCVTLREETEWVETVESGWNQLGGTKEEEIRKAIKRALNFQSNGWPHCYGNGEASHKILKHLTANKE